MSLVNIYWVKIWSSVYFCSLPVLSISTLWLLMFASYLLLFTMPYTWEVVHKHLREGGIRPTWWHWWQEQDPPLCKYTHLVMSSIAVCRTFDLGRELQYPRQGWTFPVNHLNNTEVRTTTLIMLQVIQARLREGKSLAQSSHRDCVVGIPGLHVCDSHFRSWVLKSVQQWSHYYIKSLFHSIANNKVLARPFLRAISHHAFI